MKPESQSSNVEEESTAFNVRRLYAFIDSNKSRQVEPYFLDFEYLRLYNLAQIQEDLARCQVNQDLAKWVSNPNAELVTEKKDMDDLKRLLHEYAEAIRDFDYMNHLGRLNDDEKNSRVNDLDLQDASKEPEDALRKWLKDGLPRGLAYSIEEKKDVNRKQAYSDREPPIHVSKFVDRLARFLLGFGGASLIVPMLIMSIHQSKTKSLITISIAVLVFSFVLSMALKLRNNDVLAATAAYAAVLVVFVGTSSG